MKKTLLLLTVAFLGASFQAQAITYKEYIALRGGYAAMKHQTQEHYKDAVKPLKNDWDGDAGIGSVAYGLKVGYLRAEVEGNATSTTKETKNFRSDGYPYNMSTTSRINTTSVMFNSYLELPVDFPLRPYIGAGAGMAHVKAKFKNRTDDSENSTNFSGNHFAWQVGAGLAYEITPEWSIDLGYRFMNLGSINKKIIDYSGNGTSNTLGKIRLSTKMYSAYLGIRYAL